MQNYFIFEVTVDAFHNALFILSYHFNTKASLLILCVIWVKYAYTVIFNLRTLGGEYH